MGGRGEGKLTDTKPPLKRDRPADRTRVEPSTTVWLRPPRLRTAGAEEERRATWLELFFDLVFVVAIAQLSRELVLNHSVAGFALFAALFVPVFVAWQGFSFYADRFDTDDLAFRLAMFAGMLAISALSVLLPDVVHGHRTAGFALSYVALRAIMLALYARAWRAVPSARPLIRRYGTGYSASVVLWTVSIVVPPPTRYVLWAIGLTIDLSMPPTSTRIHRLVPTSPGHVPERWGLFTLIALGESVVSVGLGAADAHWRVNSGLAAVSGFVVVACIWWLYFDGLSSVTLRGSTGDTVVYSYAHLPLIGALASVAAGVSLLIEEAGETHLPAGTTWALCGGCVIYLMSLLLAGSVSRRSRREEAKRVKVAAGVAVLVVGLLSPLLPLAVTIVALVVILLLVVVRHGLQEQSL
jgi:low temperature requirement protein LtrA